VTITAVDWADPVGARLRRQDLQERGARPAGPDEPGHPQGAERAGQVEPFLIARDRASGAPVACGALRPLEPGMTRRSDSHRPPHSASGTTVAVISWLFVVPECRRQGLARLVLAELELQARVLGWTTLQVEADAARPAALALCTAAGYRPRSRPGSGIRDGLIVFEKHLPPAQVDGWV
jgi:GNAT superfamily N-acetyltransferase